MAETKLITKTEIGLLWPIGKNLNDNRVDQHILRAQQSDFKPLLGDPMYYDVVTNPATVPNALLLSGGEYDYQGKTIFFSGAKDLLCAWSYARIESNNQVFVGRGGVVTKDTEESEPVILPVINKKANDAMSEAIRIQQEVAQFLDDNQSNYPLWRIGFNGESPQRAAFKITKIHPRSTVQSRGIDDSVPSRRTRADITRYGY